MLRGLGAALIATALAAGFAAQPAVAADAPHFLVDPFWPKPLPDNWIVGQVAGVAVDKNDHIWIIHRPGTLVDDEVRASVVENLFASDLAFLQDLYRRINTEGHTMAAVTCPSCGYEFPPESKLVRLISNLVRRRPRAAPCGWSSGAGSRGGRWCSRSPSAWSAC